MRTFRFMGPSVPLRAGGRLVTLTDEDLEAAARLHQTPEEYVVFMAPILLREVEPGLGDQAEHRGAARRLGQSWGDYCRIVGRSA